MDEETIPQAAVETNGEDSSLDDLTRLASAIINNDRTEVRISPKWIAEQVLKKVDPRRVSVPAVYGGCNLYVRQIARGLLRETFEEKETAQHNLWPELQWRYPVERAKHEEPTYALLETLREADYIYNAKRMIRDIASRTKHLDAFWAHGQKRYAALRRVKIEELDLATVE